MAQSFLHFINSIQEEIKSRLKLGYACYHLVQNLFQFAIQKLKLNVH